MGPLTFAVIVRLVRAVSVVSSPIRLEIGPSWSRECNGTYKSVTQVARESSSGSIPKHETHKFEVSNDNHKVRLGGTHCPEIHLQSIW